MYNFLHDPIRFHSLAVGTGTTLSYPPYLSHCEGKSYVSNNAHNMRWDCSIVFIYRCCNSKYRCPKSRV